MISKEKNPNRPFMQSNYINGLYDAYNRGDITDESLTKLFKSSKKNTKDPKDKSIGELFWDAVVN